MDSSATIISRAVLYEQVWTTPMMKLAAQYRVTDTGLAKACRRSNIPVPPRGYWNKLQYGKPVMKRPPLPPTVAGVADMISIQPHSPAATVDPVVAERVAEEEKPENRIQVGDQLRSPHPLIQDVSATLSKTGASAGGSASSESGANSSVLDVRVSSPARHRALRLLDALLKALETRGYKVSPSGVTIEGELVSIKVIEKEDRTKHVPTAAELAEKQRYPWTRISEWNYAPNGQLSIYTDAYVTWRKDLRKRWSDGRTVRLEDRLNDVVVGLVAIGVALRQCVEERRREAEAWAEQERLRQELARQARMEKARRANLVASADSWAMAERIRHLVVEVERRSLSNCSITLANVQEWIAWAARVADELDPLGTGIDGLLRKHEHAAEEASRAPAYGFNAGI
jgi:hypothetical protein